LRRSYVRYGAVKGRRTGALRVTAVVVGGGGGGAVDRRGEERRYGERTRTYDFIKDDDVYAPSSGLGPVPAVYGRRKWTSANLY